MVARATWNSPNNTWPQRFSRPRCTSTTIRTALLTKPAQRKSLGDKAPLDPYGLGHRRDRFGTTGTRGHRRLHVLGTNAEADKARGNSLQPGYRGDQPHHGRRL